MPPGNPTVDLLSPITSGQMLRAILAPARPEFYQQDLRPHRKLLPLQNVLGISNVLNAFGDSLPRQSKEPEP